MPSPTYDSVDRAIVDELQRDGRLSNVELAERVRLSPSACLRRTRALEEGGVIAGYRAEVDAQHVGLGLTAFISLRVHQHSQKTSQRIQKALTDIPEVVACHIVTGEADFFVEVLVPDLVAYERVLIGEILSIEQIIDARSMFSIRGVLRNGPLPLDQWVRRSRR